MADHIEVGRTYPEISINTTYSFGLDDQEFVVSFEADEPGEFLDLVQELRGTESSSYTLRDTPIFTCVVDVAGPGARRAGRHRRDRGRAHRGSQGPAAPCSVPACAAAAAVPLGPPLRMSLPAFPLTLSLPLPPKSLSLPCRRRARRCRRCP